MTETEAEKLARQREDDTHISPIRTSDLRKKNELKEVIRKAEMRTAIKADAKAERLERQREKLDLADERHAREQARKPAPETKAEKADRLKEEKAERISSRMEQLDFEDERARRQKNRRQPSAGNPFAAMAGGGMPSWMGGGGGLPPAMRVGTGIPPALMMGSGKPPAWLMGMPGTPAPAKKSRRTHPAAQGGNGLPSWFRY